MLLLCCKWEYTINMKGFPSQAASPRFLPYYVAEKGRQPETSNEKERRKESLMSFFLCFSSRYPLLTTATVWDTFRVGTTSMELPMNYKVKQQWVSVPPKGGLPGKLRRPSREANKTNTPKPCTGELMQEAGCNAVPREKMHSAGTTGEFCCWRRRRRRRGWSVANRDQK